MQKIALGTRFVSFTVEINSVLAREKWIWNELERQLVIAYGHLEECLEK